MKSRITKTYIESSLIRKDEKILKLEKYMESVIFIIVIMGLIAGGICLAYSLIEFFRCSEEVEAVVVGPEEWNPAYKVDVRYNDDYSDSGYSRVKYKYKGMCFRATIKFIKQPGTVVKIRVNPKKPNQCCMAHPDFEGFILCCIFSAIVLGLYLLASFHQ